VRVSKEIQALVMVLLGGAVLRIGIDGTYLRYVKPGFGPLLIAAGAIVVLLGLLSAWYDGLLRPAAPIRAGAAGALDPALADRRAGSADVGHDHHEHDHDGPRVAWLLLLPVLAVFLVAPPALGAYSANRSTFVGEPSVEVEPLPEGDVVDVTLRDYARRAVWDSGRTLEGRRVRLTGFVVPAEDGTWDLARLSLSCCAADALATKVEPVGDAVGSPTADEWVEVTGRWVPGGGVADPRAVPRIQVESVASIDEPREPYEPS
jgi:uncharacterized repeat protein (TIGR03943 family)